MPQENVQGIVERVSTDNDFRQQLVGALGVISKEDNDFREQLLRALDAVSKKDKEDTGWWAPSANLKASIGSILQIFISGILVVLFVGIAVLTFLRIDAPPQGVPMGDRMEMYDPFVRAKDLLTLLIPLFTTIVSFWLGFSIQEKKVNQEREKREKADEMMAKIKGRTMMPSDNDDVTMLRDHIHEIMEVPKQSE